MQDHPRPSQHRLPVLTAEPDAAGAPLGRRASAHLAVAPVAVAYLAGAAALAAALAVGALVPAPSLVELRRSGIGGVAVAALLLGFAALAATALLERARSVPALGTDRTDGADGEPGAPGSAARWPQVIAVVPAAAAALAFALLLRPRALPLAAPADAAEVLAGLCFTGAFPLLVAERWIAAVPAARLPEAGALRAVLLLPVLALVAAGGGEVLAATGFGFAPVPGTVAAFTLAGVAAELAVRAGARAFLPPPAAPLARAAVRSALAQGVADGFGVRGGVAAPIRAHLGIDFSRSWALAFIRAATVPLLGILGLLAWGLTGVVLVPLDGRAVYERLGVPVAVLRPGAHLILPWPLGATRPVAFGAVHETRLGDAPAAPSDQGSAEGPAPPGADRLWDGAHPGELTFLIGGPPGRAAPGFQTVSADIRALYRIGLSDAAALRGAYGAADAAAAVRAVASRVAATFFAGQTLDGVLGADRDAMAARLRDRVQAALDPLGTGIELLAVVIEAIHPPAGAAAAYHGVQAAGIAARASIAAERGRALALGAAAAQHAAEITNEARAGAAEMTGGAQADLARFTADRAAAAAGGQAFLLERYLGNIATGLARAPLTVIDHRILAASGGGAVLDLRPQAAKGAPGAGPGME